MKTKQDIKKKVAAKTAKGKAKVARKCGKACVAAFALLSLALAGCMGTSTPSRSQTLTITDTTINIYGSGDGTTNDVPRVELASQAMSIENSGTETQTSSPTQTTDVKPDIDVRYNDALAAASTTSKGILETLTQTGMENVLSLMSSGGSGQVTVEKKDGTKAVVTCENGQCTTCTDCTPK